MINKDELFQELKKWPTAERKLEFLDNILKKELDADVKIAALCARAQLYVEKKWFSLAAREYYNAAALATKLKEQSELYFKAALAYLSADDYLNAEDAFKKVFALATEEEKKELKEKILTLYFEHAAYHESNKRYVKAIAAYEKILTLNIDTDKRIKVYDKLIKLYEAIGKPIEANRYREQIKRKSNVT